jgi:predicted phosphodiesterase
MQVRKEIYSNPPGLFICGHSHILKVIFDKKINCLHLNPGAAGKQGWHKTRTLMRFAISEGKIQDLEVIELKNNV